MADAYPLGKILPALFDREETDGMIGLTAGAVEVRLRCRRDSGLPVCRVACSHTILAGIFVSCQQGSERLRVLWQPSLRKGRPRISIPTASGVFLLMTRSGGETQKDSAALTETLHRDDVGYLQDPRQYFVRKTAERAFRLVVARGRKEGVYPFMLYHSFFARVAFGSGASFRFPRLSRNDGLVIVMNAILPGRSERMGIRRRS